MVKIGVFIDAIQIAVAQGAITAEVAAEAIKLYAETGEFFLRRNLFDEALTSDNVDLRFEKRIQELLVAIDETAISLTRPVSDVADASDAVSKGPGKARSSSASTSDNEVLAFGKALIELLSAQDQVAKAIGKARASAATATDQVAKGLGRSRSSASTVSDVASKGPGKAIADAVATADQSTRTTNKALTDAVAASDDINGVAVADDDQVIQFVKSLTDPVGAADVLARIASYSRAFTESLSAADVVSRHTSKTLSDSAGTSEQGLIFWQSYCDPTYFAGDYVGNSRTF